MNMGRKHIRLVRPQDIRESVYGTGIIPPFFFFGKRAHVVTNTRNFLIGQCEELREKNDGFITVTLEKRIGVILPINNVVV